MAKRSFDIVLSLAILVLVAPVLGIAMLLIWRQDGGPPLFMGVRVGRNGHDFRMAKLRSMTTGSEFKGAASTTASDSRITPLGRVLRRWKLDELPQFWNVLRGEMSIVGPRPNTRRGGVERYTPHEMGLLSVRPGITDLASILFADEAEILEGAMDPDALYDEVIRPWKSQLGLLYVERRTFWIDLRIVFLTALSAVSRRAALEGVDAILGELAASDELRLVCRRSSPPPRAEPPGYAA